MHNLAAVYFRQERFEESEEYWLKVHETTRALEIAGQKSPAKSPRAASSARSLASLYQAWKKPDEAEKWRKIAAALETDYARDRQLQNAAVLERAALKAQAGRKLMDAGEFPEAEALLREVLIIREDLIPNQPNRYIAMSLLGASLAGQRQFHEAESLLLDAARTLTEDSTAESWAKKQAVRVEALQRVVDFYEAWEKPDEAAEWRERLQAKEAKMDSRENERATQKARAGRELLNAGRFAEAETLFRECLAIREKTIPNHPNRYTAMSLLGASLAEQQNLEEAESLILEAARAFTENPPPTSWANLRNLRGTRIDTLQRVVDFYEALGKRDEAAEWRERLQAAGATSEVQDPVERILASWRRHGKNTVRAVPNLASPWHRRAGSCCASSVFPMPNPSSGRVSKFAKQPNPTPGSASTPCACSAPASPGRRNSPKPNLSSSRDTRRCSPGNPPCHQQARRVSPRPSRPSSISTNPGTNPPNLPPGARNKPRHPPRPRNNPITLT